MTALIPQSLATGFMNAPARRYRHFRFAEKLASCAGNTAALNAIVALVLFTICMPTNADALQGKDTDSIPRPASDARVVYVSSSGNDAATGLAPDQAVRTIAQGYTLLRNGRGDWLLLERGHTYTLPQFVDRPSGSPASPMVVAAWGDGAAPELELGPNAADYTPDRLREDHVILRDVTIAGIPANWAMDALVWHVQPLAHDCGDRLPLFAWNLPIPSGTGLANARLDGRLESYISELAARALVPTVNLGFGGWNWPGALSLALSLQESGQPVFVLIPKPDLLEEWAWVNNTVWVEGPDASRGGASRQWPCLPLAEVEPGAEYVDGLLGPFIDRDIDIAGVWFDDESLPHPWNGVYESQLSTAECRSHFPDGVLDTVEEFKRWAYELRATLSTGILARPVHEHYPEAIVGNYSDSIYESGSSEVWGFNSVTPRQLGEMQAQMPSAYALPSKEQQWLDLMPNISSLDADRFHFWRHMTIISRSAAHKTPDTLLIPFVNRIHHRDGASQSDGRYIGMSRAAFREVLRHSILRGADTFYVFNLGHHTDFEVTPEQSYSMLEDARMVYDELLGFNEFWDRGEPVTFAVPPAPTVPADWATDRPEITIWSGLRLNDQCLVRAYTLEDESKQVTIEPWPGTHVVVTATRTPGYLLVSRSGTVQQIDLPQSPTHGSHTPMRVLHIISSLDPESGGPAAALDGLASALVKTNLRVDVIAGYRSSDDYTLSEQLSQKGINLTRVGPVRTPLQFHPQIRSTVHRAVQQADIVHIHGLWEDIQHHAARAAQQLGKPYIVRPCGMLDPWSLAQSPRRKRIYLSWRLRKNLQLANAIHFTAEAERDLTAPLKLSTPSIVEPNGLDFAAFERLPEPGTFRREFPALDDRPYVLFLSRVHYKKGLKLLIPAFAKVAPQEYALVVAGPGKPAYIEELKQLAAQYQLDDRIIFTGMLSGSIKHAAYAEADLFVLPSHQDNFGIVVIEALACGTPVLISDNVNIHPEITRSGVGAVSSLQQEHLEHTLYRCLVDAEFRGTAKKSARPFVLAHYDWNNIAERWSRHYIDLLTKTAGSRPDKR